MKIYVIEHLESRRRFRITAKNFDDAVRRTFDECMANWICRDIQEIDPSSVCAICGATIDADDTVDHEAAFDGRFVHRICPTCLDCENTLGTGEERIDAGSPYSHYDAWCGGSYYCLKCAFKRGLIDNTPSAVAAQNPESQKDSAETELVEWKAILDQLAHDMASPISFLDQYINNFTEPKDEFAGEELNLTIGAKRSMAKVKALLDHLRNHAKAHQIQLGYADFAQTIRNCLMEIGLKAREHGIEISYSGPDHLIGKFDERKVERALNNLCMNAIEAMEDKGGSIAISLLHNDRTVWIDVADTGKGVPDELIDRVFENGVTVGKKRGTGLGLAFCRKIVEAHSGSIGVHSKEGEGSVFSLVFPRCAVLKAEKISNGDDRVEYRTVLLSNEPDGWEEWLEQFNSDVENSSISLIDYESHTIGGHLNRQNDITLDPLDL